MLHHSCHSSGDRYRVDWFIIFPGSLACQAVGRPTTRRARWVSNPDRQAATNHDSSSQPSPRLGAQAARINTSISPYNIWLSFDKFFCLVIFYFSNLVGWKVQIFSLPINKRLRDFMWLKGKHKKVMKYLVGYFE